jgi:hypothetical protein
MKKTVILSVLIGTSTCLAEPTNISGVYPHLTMRNNEGECGTGAVVPWQGSLWAITYAPHEPKGSSDKLYEITPNLEQHIFKGSVGGTPANRMIHKESNQLLIGPYLIDSRKNIRTIPPSKMVGRLTGNARHLTDQTNKVYYATMEEGLYSVDVNTLKVETHIRDGNQSAPQVGIKSTLLGYHGKGLYSGQNRVIYSNNGEHGKQARTNPTTSSGALAQWFGSGDWELIRRNQFTEITGPGGIYGNSQPGTDPIWAMGWDARSVILGLLEDCQWSYYRIPKGSHSYDGAHGWNTEWPRIREIGEKDYLATMHGTFWHFPATFSKSNSAGISPRSNYLKVIGDFTKWGDRLVMGCDDSAKNEFLNKRAFKAHEGSPKQSNSNLWFINPKQLDTFGPVIGRGSVWLRENVMAHSPSDPYLFSGYDYRLLYLTHTTDKAVTFTLEVDLKGNNTWSTLREITIPANDTTHIFFTPKETGSWVRIKTDVAATAVTAHFQYRNRDPRPTQNHELFRGIATAKNPALTGGLMRGLAYNKLGFAAVNARGETTGYYEMGQNMELVPVKNPSALEELVQTVHQPENAFSEDAASFLLSEDGQTYRFPKSPDHIQPTFENARVCREVATERDLLNLGGTFYELPARNAQGVAKIRPISTHNLDIHDYCSHNGLLLFTGIDAKTNGDHIFRSPDGKAALWAGVVDDLWKLGKPRGIGGPWKDTDVQVNAPSDPYLMTAFDQKSVELAADDVSTITLEVDVDGTGLWVPYKSFKLKEGKKVSHTFPEGFSAYWVRAVSDTATTVSAIFTYQ